MKKYIACLLLLSLIVPCLSAQRVSSSANNADALVSGYEAYRNEDWTSAMFFFRKAVSVSEGSTDETWYMLIMSEMFAGEYKNALNDCVTFLQQFSFSMYVPYIQYQRGRCQHFLNQNESAILTLSDFCHQYPDHALYASALYWIAESFYAEYNYDAARALYERIVMDFPRDSKVGAAQYRIDAIDQKSREEKLLYLLKVTGEENLAAREEYERQLKMYEAEDKIGLQQRLADAQKRITELERDLEITKADRDLLGAAGANGLGLPAGTGVGAEDGVHDLVGQAAATADANPYGPYARTGAASDPEVEALKRKARQLQYILDEQIKTEDVK